MSEIRDRAKARVKGLIYTYKRVKDADLTDDLANQILSIPELAIVDKRAELPKLVSTNDMAKTGERVGRYNLLQAGWVKEVKE